MRFYYVSKEYEGASQRFCGSVLTHDEYGDLSEVANVYVTEREVL